MKFKFCLHGAAADQTGKCQPWPKKLCAGVLGLCVGVLVVGEEPQGQLL